MRWMDIPANHPECGIALYRSEVVLSRAAEISYEASADEFCRIYLDGECIKRGPERGLSKYWFKIDGKLHLEAGRHTLTAEVFTFGIELTAYAQESIRHGFYWQDSANLFSRWQCKTMENISFIAPYPDWGTYPKVEVSKRFTSAVEGGGDAPWQDAAFFEDDRVLHERMLPEMRFEKCDKWHKDGNMVCFDHYICAYGDYTFEGKGTVRLRWSETGYLTEEYNHFWLTGRKGVRNGKYFVGNWDTFEVDGQLHWQDYQFKSGRYLEIEITGNVEVKKMEFYRTGYPWVFRELPSLGSEKKDRFARMVQRTLECCSWETFMDCPFYEQLMYVGDSRITSLLVYELSDDRRLVEKALKFFAMGLQSNGMIYSHTPAKHGQMIPAFSLIWILMLRDYAENVGNRELVEELLPVARRIIESFPPENGWLFLDWVPSWDNGVPHGDCAISWLYCLALENQSFLETFCGNADKAAACMDHARQISERLCREKWNEESGMFTDKNTHYDYNEHSQVLALLCDSLPADKCSRLLKSMNAFLFSDRCGAFFSFYYLQAMCKHGQKVLFDRRLQQFLEFEDLGLDTTPENFDETRSDCHVWSGHPLYFLLRYGKTMGN